MELQAKLIETQKKLTKNEASTVMLTLNSKLNMEDAKIVANYLRWNKF